MIRIILILLFITLLLIKMELFIPIVQLLVNHNIFMLILLGVVAIIWRLL